MYVTWIAMVSNFTGKSNLQVYMLLQLSVFYHHHEELCLSD